MVKKMYSLAIVSVLFAGVLAGSSFAHEKVVVIPLGGNKAEAVGNAAVSKTGQSASYATGDDGDLENGVVWPIPRFTDNSNGTVTDNLTGLVWLKNANCFSTRLWATALTDSNTLNSGECGLTDGSAEGDWRLPNRNELKSLLALQYDDPALSNAEGLAKWTEGDAFSGVLSGYYWSSTTYAVHTGSVWSVLLNQGVDGYGLKTGGHYVWPVRD